MKIIPVVLTSFSMVSGLGMTDTWLSVSALPSHQSLEPTLELGGDEVGEELGLTDS